MVLPLIASAKSKWLCDSVTIVDCRALLGEPELGGGLHAVEQPAEAHAVLVGVQQPLVRRVALRGVAAPELVPVRQVDLDVLGEPAAQRVRVGQRVPDLLDRRGGAGPERPSVQSSVAPLG